VELGTLVASCPLPRLETTVRNVGSASASDIVVRYYAGDPEAGGEPFHDEVVAGPIPSAGGSVTVDVPLMSLPTGREVVVYARVNPADTIAECNAGNNGARASEPVECLFE
jgi:hypothetical protein